MRIPRDSTALPRATRGQPGISGNRITRLPTAALACSMRDGSRATPTNAGGQPRQIPIDRMNRSSLPLALAAVAAVASVAVLYHTVGRGDRSRGVFFYDLSAKRLFVAPEGSVPPIRGVDGPEEDAYRAVVVSTSGNSADKGSWRVAYLERYSPELKQQIEAAQAGGPPPALGRGSSANHRWVRRTNDLEWVTLGSEEGERIVAEWTTAGTGGAVPVICTP